MGTLHLQVKAIDSDSDSGEFEAILSVPTLDRDGEIVDPGAFEPLPKSIPIHVDHRFMDVSKLVARGVPFYDGPTLKVRGMYAPTPEAQSIRQLVAGGFLQTMSVGYIDADVETKDGVPHITKGELIEASFVSVPSNRDALVTAAKSHAQHLHDLAVENGAECKHSTASDPEEEAAAPAAAPPPADGAVAKALAAAAEAELALLD